MAALDRMLLATERGAFPGLRRRTWKWGYTFLSLVWRKPWRFLNYGHLPDGAPFPLAPEDEPDRPFIGLYHLALDGLPVAGAQVLEVGCGHGGGAAWVARRLGPAAVTAVDRSPGTLARARRLNPRLPNLVFRAGDAEALPFPDACFDIVLNIESSHCYGHMERFAAEAARVLRPGGHLCWADMRSPAMLPALDATFAAQPLDLIEEHRLNAGVLAALDAMEEAKAREVARYGVLRPVLDEFAAMEGSRLRDALRAGLVIYLARRYRRRPAVDRSQPAPG